jgi:hypothetical protein
VTRLGIYFGLYIQPSLINCRDIMMASIQPTFGINHSITQWQGTPAPPK